MVYSTPVPLGLLRFRAPLRPHPPNLVVEEYQIAFFCDNFFLLGVYDLEPSWKSVSCGIVPSTYVSSTSLQPSADVVRMLMQDKGQGGE
jgi:hypothetical protein